jgi:uncharacterized protein
LIVRFGGIKMLGTIVNVIAIIVGSLLGYIIKGGITKSMNDTVVKGLALCVILISILEIISVADSLQSNDTLIIIFSVAIGGIIGEAIDIDKRLKDFGDFIERKLNGLSKKSRKSTSGNGNTSPVENFAQDNFLEDHSEANASNKDIQPSKHNIAEGFVTASLIYCVGAMAIVGSLESGLTGNHKTLFAKSVIDGISAIAFTSSMGIGVLLAGISVFIYQGTITMAAGLLKGLLVTTVVNDMTAVGSVLIIGIGLNMLGSAKIKVANLLPAIFLPIVYQIIVNFIG